MTDVGLRQRIAQLEAMFEIYDVKLTDICVDVITNKDKVKDIEGECAAHSDQLQHLVGNTMRKAEEDTIKVNDFPTLAQVVSENKSSAIIDNAGARNTDGQSRDNMFHLLVSVKHPSVQ